MTSLLYHSRTVDQWNTGGGLRSFFEYILRRGGMMIRIISATILVSTIMIIFLSSNSKLIPDSILTTPATIKIETPIPEV